MRKEKIRIRKFIKVCSAAFALALTVGSFTPVQASSGEYEVIFRAGSKGNFNGTTSVTKTVVSGSTVGELPTPDMKSGYYQTGWSPEVTADTVVTKREVFVAQYARITDGVEYRVKYVDEKGTALATEKIAKTQKGATVTEKPAQVDGFAATKSSENVVINNSKTEIVFTYTSTAEAPVITETETVVTDQTTTQTGTATAGTTTAGTAAAGTTTGNAGGTAAGTGTTQDTQGTAGTQTEGTENVELEDGEVPKGNTQLEDEEVPKAKAGSETKSSYAILIGGIAGVLVLAAAIALWVRKRRIR